MTLMIFDTKTQNRRDFVSRKESEVLMYICGPTVYGPSHLGHARSYIIFDVIRRYLEFQGFEVKVAMNLTDVEDSITRVARETNKSVKEVADANIDSFLRDMDSLGIKRADAYPRVTEHISEIIATIESLIERSYAYIANGDVFFRVSKTKSLGMLSHSDFRGMTVDTIAEPEKRENPLDFVLWRRAKEGHPSWSSPWGEGRPGWHIECFALSRKYLGEKLDIHCGGVDLKFPHHESEAMISEAFVEQDWCNYWLHNGFITIEQEKMSKSLGNFVQVRDLLDKYPGVVIRLCLLKEQYRNNVEYDRDCFKNTEEEMNRIGEAISIAKTARNKSSGGKVDTVVNSCRKRFFKAMDNDFDASEAVRVLMELTEAVHELGHFSSEEGESIIKTYEDFAKILGLHGLN